MINHFLAWHDKLPEPKRAFITMVMVLVLVIIPTFYGGIIGAFFGTIAVIFLARRK